MELLNKTLYVISEILETHFSKDSFIIRDELTRITGGADTEIFSFTVEITEESMSYDLILRLYRKGATIDLSRREFETLNQLYNAGLSVPKPYGYTGIENPLKRPFLIMEKIDGEMLAEIIFNENRNKEAMLIQFMGNLAEIHNLNWQKSFTNIPIPDVSIDSYQIIKNLMRGSESLIEKFEISELYPLITWLKRFMHDHPCEKVVLVHGDYHGMNVMVRENGEFVTIDWMDIKLGDRRQDLAFSIIATDSASTMSLKDHFIKTYEDFTNEKIEGIEYFMVLSVLRNFIRVYSMLFNYDITNENDNTKEIMIGEYSQYVNYFVKMIKNITGLDFPKIEAELTI